MDGLTIQEAAATTGWSSRMLRYIEREGLIAPRRSDAGYRLYGPGELQRLRTLRVLLEDHGLNLGEVGFALRLSHEPETEKAVRAWLEARPSRPDDVPAKEWLRFEQEKHQRLLAEAAQLTTTTT